MCGFIKYKKVGILKYPKHKSGSSLMSILYNILFQYSIKNALIVYEISLVKSAYYTLPI